MKCACCGQEIDRIVTHRFDYDGSDYPMLYPIFRPIQSCEENAVYFDTDANWCGYELTEEEMIGEIECPICGKFPFRHKEVQIYEYVRVVCFDEQEEESIE